MRQVLLLGTLDDGRLLGDAGCVAVRSALPDVHLLIAGRDEPPPDLAPSCEAISSSGAVEAALRDADAVVCTGSPFAHALLPNIVQVCAHRRGSPVALVGVGGIERSGRGNTRLAARLARSADLLVLRDDAAAASLAAAGEPAPFRIGADLAWPVLAPVGATRRSAGDRVTISLRAFAPGREHLACLAAAIDDLSPHLVVRVVAPDDPGVALRAIEFVRALRRAATIAPLRSDIRGLAEDLRGDRLVVTTDRDVVIAAAAAGTPSLSITGDAEDAALARRLGQIAVFPDASTSVLRHACELAVDSDRHLPAAVAREIELAEQTLDRLRALVDPAFAREATLPDRLPLSAGRSPW